MLIAATRRTGWTLAVMAAVLVSGSWTEGQQGSDFVVIVNPDNAVEMLTHKEASDLFLKKRQQWQDGRATEPVDQEFSAEIRRAFTIEVHGRKVENVRSYWQKRIFSGTGTPPPELAGDAAVIEFVRTHPGGVGYVSPVNRLNGVRVMQLITAPVLVKQVPPVYPARAQRMGVEGNVQLRITISAEGKVSDVKILAGLPHGLNEAAMDAVRRWRFNPASAGDKPVESMLNVSVGFKL